MISFQLITGPMFAGKTTLLARMLAEAGQRGARTTCLRPAIDTRYNRALGFIQPLYRVDTKKDATANETVQRTALYNVIAIDEVQFIAGWTMRYLEAMTARARQGNIRIIAAGLDYRADGRMFDGMADLLTRSDMHFRLEGTCVLCGSVHGTRTLSMDENPPADGIRIGGDGYYCVCKTCWDKHQAPATPMGVSA